MLNYIHTKLRKLWSVVKQNKFKTILFLALSAIAIPQTSLTFGLYLLFFCIIFDLALSKFMNWAADWLTKYCLRKPVDFYDGLANAHKKAYEEQVSQANNIKDALFLIPNPLINLIQEYAVEPPSVEIKPEVFKQKMTYLDRHGDYYSTERAFFSAQRFFCEKPYSLEKSAYLQDLISISFKSPEILPKNALNSIKVGAEDWFRDLLMQIATKNNIDLFRALLKYSNTHLKQYTKSMVRLIMRFNGSDKIYQFTPEACEKFLKCIAQERPDIKNEIESNFTYYMINLKPESFRDHVFELLKVGYSKPEEHSEYQQSYINRRAIDGSKNNL